MKIKRIEIKGFKSFPDKTILEFKPGITAVVGPNGCGKSNILEAIRWVMGEQRVRTLRGKKMEDVIFNGSEARKAVGMAEVRLVLSNTEGMAPESMAEYDEIMIGRRLFRDGESNYEINNIGCRLADITDFFLDTGVGKNSYAIIEQGRVDMVVASRPEDRRVLIEEAAGISRYKSRKEAALKKLDLTKQNLQRIHDLIGEVKRQAASLKRQASRAEAYRKLSERIRELDIGVHAFRCGELTERAAGVKSRLRGNEGLLAEAEASAAGVAATLEEERLRALETENAVKENLEAHHRLDISLTAERARIESLRSRITQLTERRRQCTDEKDAAEGTRREHKLREEELARSAEDLNTQLRHAQEDLRKALEESCEAEETFARESREAERLRDEVFRLLQEVSQQKNDRERLSRRGVEVSAALSRIERETASAGGSLEEERAQRDLLAGELARIVDNRTAADRTREELTVKRRESSDRITALREETSSREREYAADKARLQSLEEMHGSFESYGQGVRFLMENRGEDPEAGIFGPLAEMIEVPPEFQKALTAALGERIGHLVVASPREGAEAAHRLRIEGAGRSSFIPLNPRGDDEPFAGTLPADLTSLRDAVRFKEGCEDLAEFLLDRCFVAPDIARAVEIWERNGTRLDLVTPHGEVLNRHGVITGGTTESPGEEIFERRRQISELSAKTSLGKEAISRLSSALGEEEAALRRLIADLEENSRVANELNLSEVRVKKDLERIEGHIATQERRLQVLSLERERLDKEAAEISDGLAKADAEILRLEKARTETDQVREALSSGLEERRAAVQAKTEEAAALRVRVAQWEERSRSLAREALTFAETARRNEDRIKALTEEIARNEADAERSALEQTAAADREKESMEEHERLAGVIESLRTLAAERAVTVKQLSEQSRLLSTRLRELADVVHELKTEAVRLDQVLEGLVEKIIERYHVDPRTVDPPEALPDETEIADARSKLESMGEVNLAAIGESRETEERLAFLLAQEKDLTSAVDSLYATIQAINKTTRERFRSAFDSINEKFQEIFTFLFRGGEARLELTDEEDLLETGVDIMARPPGKRIQNMDLLSGGEKALTAVALIFAIFLIRPSPFCLLDEVDAPLDDANISRFAEMLRKLSHQTQFLTITHNKRSMEEADCLYGVTMEQPGASCVVSVQFAS